MNEREVGDKLGVDWNKVDYKQFCMGMKVELEHKDITKSDPILTAKIVLAHLKELPDYYTRLERMEKNGKNDKADKESDSMSVLTRKAKNE